ncbi:MAG: NAD(P)H-binding protein [Cytophagales bacterium]|nr:NAD(P)H-binding protein [Cytophagales bacterium]
MSNEIVPLLQLVEGDARNYEDIHRLVEGCGAIISTLGQPKNEPSIFSDASKNVVRAMLALSVNRYVVTTGINVDTPVDEKDPKTKFATDWMHENFPETTQDKQVEHDFLATSTVAWTMVRLPMIIQTEESFEIQTDLKNCAGDKISAFDLANFLIDQLEDQTYVGKSPFLSNL